MLFAFILFLLFSVSVPIYAEEDAFSSLLNSRFAALQDEKSFLTVQDIKIFGSFVIKRIYQHNHNQPLWNDASVQQLLQEVNAIEFDGLQKSDYLLEYWQNDSTPLEDLLPKARVNQELLLTESLLRLVYHLRFGKVDPESLDPDWNYSKRLDIQNPVTLILESIQQHKINDLINSERPNDEYPQLKKALARYFTLKEQGGWPAVEIKQTLKPGKHYPEIPLIKQRLQITGEYPGTAIDLNDLLFDDTLTKAVKRFQHFHGLDNDGLIGKQTVAAMNIPVNDRIDQIRVNLERMRWTWHKNVSDYLLVDIAGFKAYLVQNNDVVWDENVQVGKAFTATPIFKGQMGYLEFNPTWTIPPSIIKKTVLPNLKKDPNYLNKKGYHLLDFKGNRLDPLDIDWKTMKHFPYMVRQPAGKNNALGQVKFIFPNSHFVFLHDTNHRELFNRPVRTFSAGCIRVNNPIKLASLLLSDKPQWNSTDKIKQLIATGKTKRINSLPIPVLITYTTAGIDQNNQLIFKSDIYNRDPDVLKGLNGPITVSDKVRNKVRQLQQVTPIQM